MHTNQTASNKCMAKTPTKTENKKVVVPGSVALKNKNQEQFCQFYAGIATRNFFGNATQSYLQTFGGQEQINALEEKKLTLDPGSETGIGEMLKIEAKVASIKNSAKSAASYLLTNVDVSLRCNWLTNRFIDPEMADREMGFVIGQREDLRAKVSAYTAVAKVKNRLSNKLEGEFIFKWESDDE